MNHVDIAASFVAPFEGFVGHVYKDAVGVLTIGYGETDKALLGKYRNGIAEPIARKLLRDRLGQFDNQIARLIKAEVTEQQRAALLSFAYNLGSGALASSTLLKLLNTGHYAKAANEFPKWDKAGGQELEGLKRRRLAERALFLQGSNRKTRLIARATFHG